MKKIIKTIFISGMAVVINYLINLFLTSYITGTLGIEAYGFVTLSKTFVEYASVITIALTSFIVRYVSVSYHHNDYTEANSYYSSSIVACLTLSAIIFICACILILKLESIINVPSNIVDSVKILFLISFLSFLITTISSPFTSAAYIKNKLDVVGFIKILSYVVNAGIMVFLFRALSPELWFVGIGSLCAAITLFVGNYALTKAETPELKFCKSLMSFSKINNLFKNGIWNSLNQLGNELNSGLDLLISNLMLSAVAMGQISVVKNIGIIFSTLNITIFQPFNPALIEAYSKGNTDQLKNELRKAMRICGLFSAVVFSGFIALGQVYMKLWLPEQDFEFLYRLAIINIGYNITAGVMQPVYYVSTLTLKNKLPCVITISGGILNIILMYFLLKYTSLGAIAVVGTTTVIMLCINLFFNPVYSAKCINISPRFFYKIIVKHILGNVVLILIFRYIGGILNPQSWMGIIMTAFVMALVGAPIYIFMTMDNIIGIQKKSI